jgi:hypothetical protein
MRATVLIGVTAVGLAIGVRTAEAQVTRWSDRARVSINVGAQLTSTTFTSTTSFPVYLETSTINTSYTAAKGKLFDGGFLYRLSGNFGIGVDLSFYSERHDAGVTGSIPHPFFFTTPRSFNGTAAGLQRSEFAANVQAAYVITSRRYDIAISGGPTIFRVSQDLVSNIVYTETYPYDTVTFTSATTVSVDRTKVGFNVGADFGYKLSPNFGLGGVVRFSRASLSFPLTGSATDVNADAGGLQAGGGVRFYF